MKPVIDALDQVVEAFRGEYEPKDGKFVLKLDAAPTGFVKASDLAETTARLGEFRENNRALYAKLKALDGIDVAAYEAMKVTVTELEQVGVKGAGDVAALISAAKAEVAATHKAEQTKAVAELTRQLEDTRGQLARTRLEHDLLKAGTKAGVDERAMTDFVTRGLGVFALVNGVATPRKGETPIFSKAKPSELMNMDEYAEGLREEAPHLFRPSRGGGAGANQLAPQGKKVISSDPAEVGRHLEQIARGEAIIGQA